MTRWPADIGGYRRVELLESPAESICETFLALRPDARAPDTELTFFASSPADPDSLEHWVDEVTWLARRFKRLEHPGLERVFDCESVGSVTYLACEHLPGLPLKSLTSGPSGKKVDGGVAAALIAAAAEGLEVAHDLRSDDGMLLQFVHRDISAKDIVLTKDGRVAIRGPWRERLLHLFCHDTSGHYAVTGVHSADSVGGVRWPGGDAFFSRAPEVWTGKPYTDHADVYSLAVALFELTTGARCLGWEHKNGWEDKDILELLRIVQDEGARPPSSLVPGYPRELEDLLLGVLGPKSRRTPVRAGPFARSLRDFAARHGGTPERVQAFVSEVFGPAPG